MKVGCAEGKRAMNWSIEQELPHSLKQGLRPGNNRRVPHISLVFREMWDTTALRRRLPTLKKTVQGSRTRGCTCRKSGYLHLADFSRNVGYHRTAGTRRLLPAGAPASGLGERGQAHEARGEVGPVGENAVSTSAGGLLRVQLNELTQLFTGRLVQLR